MICPQCGAKMKKYAFVDEEAKNPLRERGWVCTDLRCRYKMRFKKDA